MKLEFFFDYGSPYSYLANSQITGLRVRTQCEVVYRPMLLGGVFKATGNSSPAEESVVSKLKYQSVEMQRWVDYYDVPFASNPFFPVNTIQIMRAAHAAQQMGVFEEFHTAIFGAMWERERNLGDPQIIVQELEDSGLDGQSLVSRAASPEVKELLRETSDEAVARGVFGAPTFFIGDEMFFGNDRLPFVERRLIDC
jgi:2-hydroxychromene-2-carboxylate isomerase